jgi:hypothetical protein
MLPLPALKRSRSDCAADALEASKPAFTEASARNRRDSGLRRVWEGGALGSRQPSLTQRPRREGPAAPPPSAHLTVPGT